MRLYREDLAVSGQHELLSLFLLLGIIPRGFGGIRTTRVSVDISIRRIIPRGFGGIRTTERRLPPIRSLIIDDDYTERIWRYQDNCACSWLYARLGLYREDLAVSGQHPDIREFIKARLYREDLAVSGQHYHARLLYFRDYTERIWRYQDNNKFKASELKSDYTERIWRYQDNTDD